MLQTEIAHTETWRTSSGSNMAKCARNLAKEDKRTTNLNIIPDHGRCIRRFKESAQTAGARSPTAKSSRRTPGSWTPSSWTMRTHSSPAPLLTLVTRRMKTHGSTMTTSSLTEPSETEREDTPQTWRSSRPLMRYQFPCLSISPWRPCTWCSIKHFLWRTSTLQG